MVKAIFVAATSEDDVIGSPISYRGILQSEFEASFQERGIKGAHVNVGGIVHEAHESASGLAGRLVEVMGPNRETVQAAIAAYFTTEGIAPPSPSDVGEGASFRIPINWI